MESLVLNPEFVTTQDSASVICYLRVFCSGLIAAVLLNRLTARSVGVNKRSALGRTKDEV